MPVSSLVLSSPPLDFLRAPLEAASSGGEVVDSVASPTLWFVSIAAVLALVVLDFIVTRKPHEVSMKEAIGWSVFYIGLPLAFGAWAWSQWGSDVGIKYYSGYLVEKALSVDNLFVFIVILSSFAVPRMLRQRVLLIGVVGALVLRGVFIWLGAELISRFSWVFFIFGLILALTAVKVVRDALAHHQEVDAGNLPVVRMVRKLWPVTDAYDGSRLTVKQGARRALTPLAVVIAAIIGTDLLFAVDSVPAVYGITSDPYLVFATNAFALLGLRALYFLLEGSLQSVRYLPYGLGAILAFIALKLLLHGAHLYWPSTPDIGAVPALLVIAGILVITIVASLIAARKDPKHEPGLVTEVL